jgi:hypothetical protein
MNHIRKKHLKKLCDTFFCRRVPSFHHQKRKLLLLKIVDNTIPCVHNSKSTREMELSRLACEIEPSYTSCIHSICTCISVKKLVKGQKWPGTLIASRARLGFSAIFLDLKSHFLAF